MTAAVLLAMTKGDDMTKNSLPRVINYAAPEGGGTLRTDQLRVGIDGSVSVLDADGALTGVDKPGLDALAKYEVFNDFVRVAKGLGDGSA